MEEPRTLLTKKPDFVPPGQVNTDPTTTHEFVLPGGTKRSEKKPPYHLVPRYGRERTAKRFGFGATKYGEWNWTLSLRTKEDSYAFAVEAYNHMQEHMLLLGQRDAADDHLGAIGWAVEVLATVEAKWGCHWWELGPKTECGL